MNEVIVLSGMPGSGKSHYTRGLKDIEVFSADHFFINADGEYKFDHTKIGEAHAKCFRDYVEHLQHQRAECDKNENNNYPYPVVVDNTNLTAAEMAPYVQAANAYGWPVKIVTISCPPEVAFKRQTHNVPLAAYMHMFANFRDRKLPPYWKQETVKGNA
jgi:predicted kinase